MFRKVVLMICMLIPFSVVATDEENSSNLNSLPESPDTCECGISGYPGAIQEFHDKIIGGKEVKPPNKYPWMVELKLNKKNRHHCGGTIISPFYVLTAAHCFRRNREYTRAVDPFFKVCATPSGVVGPCFRLPSEFSVFHQAGKRLPSQSIDIEVFWVHQQYNLTHKHNDIALIRVKKPFPCDDYTRPICLPKNVSTLNLDQKLIVSGWGQTETARGSYLLLETTTNVKDCNEHYGHLPTHICLQAPGTCYGDSGGPAFAPVGEKFYIFGITSFGASNCLDKPNAYVNVTYFLEWIDDHIQKQL